MPQIGHHVRFSLPVMAGSLSSLPAALGRDSCPTTMTSWSIRRSDRPAEPRRGTGSQPHTGTPNRSRPGRAFGLSAWSARKLKHPSRPGTADRRPRERSRRTASGLAAIATEPLSLAMPSPNYPHQAVPSQTMPLEKHHLYLSPLVTPSVCTHLRCSTPQLCTPPAASAGRAGVLRTIGLFVAAFFHLA